MESQRSMAGQYPPYKQYLGVLFYLVNFLALSWACACWRKL